MSSITVLKRFVQQLDHIGIRPDRHSVLVALSGGLDSVVLLHLLRRSGFQTAAAHVNFGLRGKESEEDQDFCQRLCEGWNIKFHTKTFETMQYAGENQVSVQMAARTLRYEWFDTLLKEEKYDRLATGHQADDQAETVLMRIIDGSGPKALAGIPLTRDSIIRPMLTIDRESILAYARENTLEWREDSSNSLVDYRRNAIRLDLLPRLRQLNPSISETLRTLAERIQHVSALSDAIAEEMLNGRIVEKAGHHEFNAEGLLEHSCAEHLFYLALSSYGINSSQVQDLIRKPIRSGRVIVTPSHNITLDRQRLFIQERGTEVENIEWQIASNCSSLITDSFKLESRRIQADKCLNERPTEKHIAWLDEDLLHFPLSIGKWNTGDRFQPLGMNTFKKVSDHFIDNKVPVFRKEQALIIRSQGEIVWIAGDRIDHRYRVTDQTRKILELRFRHL
ncbi:MAG: tRNA lysidine(34) synthetase TilS [Bacteroidota bacterium]|jgi:tRNA(Ile)-lysidine synthase